MSKRLYVILCLLLALPIYLLGIVIIGRISLLFPTEVIAPHIPIIIILYTEFYIILYPFFSALLWHLTRKVR